MKNRKIITIICGMFLISCVSSLDNASIMYGQNASGDFVPLKTENDGTLKVDLDFMNLSVGNIIGTENMSLGEWISFTLGGMIDNMVDGWIKVTGNLNVTMDNLSLGGKTLTNDNGILRWGGVDVDTNISILYGQNSSGSTNIISTDENRVLNTNFVGGKSNIWNTVGGVVQLVNAGDVKIDGNLNITGNLSGGSPVKIIGGLTVEGDTKFGSSGDSCSGANEGSIRYNSSLKRTRFCDGTNWVSIDV